MAGADLWFLPPFVYVCLSVFPHDISKTDAARMTKLISMFHDESWKTICFGVKVTSHKTLPVWVFAIAIL